MKPINVPSKGGITMSAFTLKNNNLTIVVDENGAELTSILRHDTDTEYLWNADPVYWKRHAPILFPVVGSLKNKSYSYQGKTYSSPQHGFAREMSFKLTNHTEQELWFVLEANEETKKVYPFDFRLELGYRLEENKVTAFWKVINTDHGNLFFSIGGHPAFTCPLGEGELQSDYYLLFDSDKPIHYMLVDEAGLAVRKPFVDQHILTTEEGYLPIFTHLFDRDALIIEENQFHRISLADSNKKPYLSVDFTAPLFGLWSPAKKKAPFVCIEPWYGRCDASDFDGTLEDREYGNCLAAGDVFEASYTITIHE
jgi:galactose mutarotase-like enzyme